MENILAMLSETIKEVFRTMMSMDVDIRTEKINDLTDKVHISSITTLDGTIQGALVFHCSNNFAQKIALTLVNDETESLQEFEVKDAISEIINIIAGLFKSKVTDFGYSFSFSIPTTLNWQEYIDETKSVPKENIIKFKSNEEYFFLELLSESKNIFNKAS